MARPSLDALSFVFLINALVTRWQQSKCPVPQNKGPAESEQLACGGLQRQIATLLLLLNLVYNVLQPPCVSPLPWHLQKAILRQQNLGSSDQAPAGGQRYTYLCFSLAKGTRWQRHEQRAFPRELIVLQAQMPQWLRHRSLTKLEPRNNMHLPLRPEGKKKNRA